MISKNILIGGIITVVTALMVAATGWNFKATAEIPAKYVTKEEHRTIHQKLDAIKDLILRLHTGDKDD